MKAAEFGRVFVGSCVVYGVVAACSASPDGSISSFATGGAASESDAGSGGLAVVTTGANAGNGGAEGSTGATGYTGGTAAAATVATTGGTSVMDPVATALADPVSGTRLKAKYYSGADGSKVFVPSVWWDSQLGTDCWFTKASDGATRCLPSGAYGGVFYSDAACSVQIGYSFKSACVAGAPEYVTATDSVSCSGATIYAIGATYTGTTLYSKSGATCSNVTSSLATYLASYNLYQVGAVVPAASFVSATLVTSS